jgi:hypothetical protein
MTQSLQDRIDAYLNGLLSEEETNRFEQDLLKEDIAAEFREALLMRELLHDLPPDSPPTGLIERIEASLALDSATARREIKSKQSSSFGRIINAFGWGLRWPGYALAGMSGGSGVLKDSFSSINMVGYSLGPLREPVQNRIRSIQFSPKSLLKFGLSKLW